MDRLSAPQQNAIGAYFANLLRKVEQDSGPEFLPRGLDVMGLVRQLALPSAETVEKLSYGDPLFRMPTQSNIPITTDRGYVAEVLGMAPAVPAASRATTRISNEMADQLVRAIMGNPQATAPGALEAAGQMAPLARMGAIRPYSKEEIQAIDEAILSAKVPKDTYFHGTDKDFKEFRKKDRGLAYYFTPDPMQAASYAGDVPGANIRPVKLDIKKTYRGGDVDKIMEVVKQEDDYYPYTFSKMREFLEEQDPKAFHTPSVVKALKKLGYDSFVEYEGGVEQIGVFSAKAVKPSFGGLLDDTSSTRLLEPEAATSSFKVVQPGDQVSGLTVREEVPNMSSISATLDDYEVLSGIREVPRGAFDKEYLDSLSFEKLDKRTKDLANQINESKEINPMIVGVDSKGAYIIEGGHRFDALMAQDTKSIPAMVVIDKSDPPTEDVLRGLLSE